MGSQESREEREQPEGYISPLCVFVLEFFVYRIVVYYLMLVGPPVLGFCKAAGATVQGDSWSAGRAEGVELRLENCVYRSFFR